MATGNRKIYGIIFLTLFLDLIGFSIIFPVFAHIVDFYQQQDSGLLAYALASLQELFPRASDDQIAALFGGVLFGAYALLQFIMSPIWGSLSDRYGRRPILLSSVGGNLLSYVLWIWAGDFALLLVARLLAGAMSGNISTASAAIADMSTEENRAKGMGMLGAAIGLGFIMGPACGGLIYSFLPQLGEQNTDLSFFALNPFSFLALFAAILSAINLLLLWRSFPETLQKDQRSVERVRFSVAGLFNKELGRDVIRCNLLYLCYMILFAAMESTLVFLAKEQLAFTPGHIASLFVMIGFIGVFIQGGMIRRLVPRLGEKKLLVCGLSIQVPGYALLAMLGYGASEAFIWLGTGLLAAGSACIMPTVSSLVSRNAAAHVQGRAMGLFRGTGALGRAVGPFLGASCYFFISPAAPYVCGACAMIIPLLLAVGVRQPSTYSPAPEVQSPSDDQLKGQTHE